MPWNQVELMYQREQFIEKLMLSGANISALCKQQNISRKTAYKWLQRYKDGELTALKDQSKTPHNSPHKIDDSLEQIIVQAHKSHPYWGPRKLRDFLINEGIDKSLPTKSTFERVLKRNGCKIIRNNKSKPATTRFERSKPNELWQMDFKGSFMTHSHRCYPLTIIDDYSRYSIGVHACRDETNESVVPQLIACFKEFGLPEQINVDNGNPWGNASSDNYTKFAIWLIKKGIRITHSAPYHPQTNGKNERFHRTLKLEVLHEKKYKNCCHIQKEFDEWRHMYNYQRPHEALDGKPPSSRYQPSIREYSGLLIKPEYDEGECVRKVHSNTGAFRFKGERYQAGKGLCGEHIAVRETAKENEYCVFFMDTFIRKFRLKQAK